MQEILYILKPNVIVKGSLFPEEIRVITALPTGESIQLIGYGMNNQVINIIIPPDKFHLIEVLEQETYNGSPEKFRIAIEALRIGLAYEYDPYFTLSISKVDPLPHQLEAVYEYFLKIPRIRFLLADDPGAGKTIMAGLLIKELKARGLVKRILIVTPANLTFQWQRELSERFRENFSIIRGDVLRLNYGVNPWLEKNQVLTSVSWVALQEDANSSLLSATWDLIIVDEAHKMRASDDEHKTYAYKLGEDLSKRTDHFLLMTATPHKGDPDQFRLFLRLLDEDVYADISSLEEAMRNHSAPFYLRRVKEALITFPDPVTKQVKSLFTKRIVKTLPFKIKDDEWDFYESLTKYVTDQSAAAAAEGTSRSRVVGFTMAMLQRRFASSLYAVRRTLERMRDRRNEILSDPEGFRQKQIEKRIPDNFEDLPEEEQQVILETIEGAVVSFDPDDLRRDIENLSKLISSAKLLEAKEIENKIIHLKLVLTKYDVFKDTNVKLLIFTEHKDTLDYLAGDGKNERPLGKLVQWGLKTTQIHGAMKVGDRNTAGTRLYAEREFKENAQIMVATEAAGEGINLQFCWLMINYDIPWNPIRLEQRMGRIHRYGQQKDCLIFNFVSTNTREGRVMEKLFERLSNIENDLDPNKTGKIFNVLGDIFPSNQLEKMIREMYSHNTTEQVITERIIHQVDLERFKEITNSTLEGLAKRELNLSTILGKTLEAKEKRLVPETIQDFFLRAAEAHNLYPKEIRGLPGVFHVEKIPRNLLDRGEKNEQKYGVLGREYKKIVFAKEIAEKDPLLEWVTPGHPLFEVIREETVVKYAEVLQKGAIFYDLNASHPSKLHIYSASVTDGLGQILHQNIFIVSVDHNGEMLLKQPTVFLDFMPGHNETGIVFPKVINSIEIEKFLLDFGTKPYLAQIQIERAKEIDVVSKHLTMSLDALIERQNKKLAEFLEMEASGKFPVNLQSQRAQTENRILELVNRKERRESEFENQRQCMVSSIKPLGTAIVLPHPEKNSPDIKAMVPDAEIEATAVQFVIRHEESLGYKVESVENDNRGFDLISRKFHPEDPKTAVDIKFIEVKGRSETGTILLSRNEYNTAQRLKEEYWLYIVYNCASSPELHIINNPSTNLNFQPVIKIEHYSLSSIEIKRQL